jgi:hypothetical protein
MNYAHFKKCYDEFVEKNSTIEMRFAGILITIMEDRNKESKPRGDLDYFQINLNKVLDEADLTGDERKNYASLIGKYFNLFSQLSKKRKAVKPSKKSESGVVDPKSGQYNLLF